MTDDILARLRDGKNWLNGGACCGDVDDAECCAAPACIFGEALKQFHEAADEIERLRAELAAERERLDFIETYVKARAEEHEFLSGMAGGALSGKKKRVRAHEASTILGRIREVRK